MYVIHGVFGEKEFAMMSDKTILLLGKLLDDKVASVLLKYMENPEADKAIVERIDNLIGDKVRKYTFHLKVLEAGVIDTVRKLSLQTLAYSEEDWDMLEEQLTFLEENKGSLRGSIEPRESKDFKDFLAEIKQLSKDMMGMPKDYNNLPQRVQANKDFFCSSHERSRSTRVGLALTKSTDWEIALKGIRYLKLCKKAGVSDWLRREF